MAKSYSARQPYWKPRLSVCRVIAHLIGEKRIERYQQRPLGQLDDRAEADLIGVLLIAMVDGLLISALDGKGDTVALALDQLVLSLEFDRIHADILAVRLISAEREGE